MDGPAIQHWQRIARTVLVAPQVQDYAIRLILATHPAGPFAAAPTNRLIRCGASPLGRARRSCWPPRCGPCWKADTTSASRTFAGYISRL